MIRKKPTIWSALRNSAHTGFYPMIILLGVVLIYTFPLFSPETKLIVTPDFGLSDAWHDGMAKKYYLYNSLRSFELPVWTDLIGGGYPMLAEGQIGTFFFPNFFLPFIIPSFPLYFNLLLVLALFTGATGMYSLLRILKISPASALFGAISFTLSGINIPQMVHIMHLQSLTLIPWVLWAYFRLLENRSILMQLMLSLILSQQLFSGFPQGFVISIVALTVFETITLIKDKKPITSLLRLSVTVIFSVLLAAAQVLPSNEFRGQVVNKGIFMGETAMYFSYPYKHFATLLHPFLLGNPRAGSYPHFRQFDGSIFWENSGYIGLIPLSVILIGIFSAIINKHKVKINPYFTALLLTATILMLGKHSPFYFIHSFPPFNYFRVPSRFIWLFVPSIIYLSALYLDRILVIIKKYVNHLASLIILIHTCYLLFVWNNYHMLMDPEVWLTEPISVQSVKKDNLIFTIGQQAAHNEIFYKSGWSNPNDYTSLRNMLYPNSNIYFNIRHLSSYSGRFLEGNSIMDAALSDLIDDNRKCIREMDKLISLLKLNGVGTIISAYAPEECGADNKTPSHNKYKVIADPGDNRQVYIYPINDSAPLISQAYSIKKAHSVTSMLSLLLLETNSVNTNAIVEPGFPDNVIASSPAEIYPDISHKYNINVSLKIAADKTLLIINRSYYPGWKAVVDGIPTELYRINARQTGILIDQGSHYLTVEYDMFIIYAGIIISILAHTAAGLILIRRLHSGL